MTQCSKMNNVVALLVGWMVGWFVSDMGKKKNVFNKYKWKVFHLTIYTGDNFSAVLIHNEQYNHIF